MRTQLIAIAATAVFAATLVLAAAPERFNNTVCPVMGNKVPYKKEGSKVFVAHNGIRYELCCSGCVKPFKADPAKYLAKLPNNGTIIELGNTVCPVKGGAVDKKLYAVYNGTKVFFCCPACNEVFMADPEKYIKKATAELGKPTATMPAQPQVAPDAKTHCPPAPVGQVKNPNPDQDMK